MVIDCCALLNVLSLNAIFACDLMLVPVSCDYLALASAREVERALNALEPVLKRRLPRRYVLTRYDARRRMSEDVIAQMAEVLRPDEICATRIRENVKLAESPAVAARRVPARAGQQGRAGLRSAVRRAAAAAGGALSATRRGRSRHPSPRRPRRRPARGQSLPGQRLAAADETDHRLDVERFEARWRRRLPAAQDLAVPVHLPQSALGVLPGSAARIEMFSTRWPRAS